MEVVYIGTMKQLESEMLVQSVQNYCFLLLNV